MKNAQWRNTILSVCTLIVSLAFSAVTLFFSRPLALTEMGVIFVLSVWLVFSRVFSIRRMRRLMVRLTKRFDYSDNRVLETFPFPAVVCNQNGDIEWCSEKFLNRVLKGNENINGKISALLNGMTVEEVIGSEECNVVINGFSYKIQANSFRHRGEQFYVFFYTDISELKEMQNKYELSRPRVLLIKADNVGDDRYDFRDSERAEIRSMIESEIEKWCSSYSCIMRRLSDTRYLIVTDKKGINQMAESRFPILDAVRTLKYKEYSIASSLSVGVGDGEDFPACEHRARKALEMALDRGGDQVAVCVDDGYDFFGGLSKSVEKRSKSEVRVISNALCELMNQSNEVIVMGHKWPDLDAMGAAMGICAAAEALEVPAYIAVNAKQTLSAPILERIAQDKNCDGLLIDESNALRMIDKKTLLVVVDTHIKHFVDFPEVYKKASHIFVVDHHRKAVDYIDNAEVFHLDSSASSASELVTELLQYVNPEPQISKLTADALLAGITLDTKNFVLRSGVRTFEAAAYLKQKGADTVSVRKMFSNSMEVNRLRNELIAKAELFDCTAICVADFESKDLRIICSQAADELLNISGVKASFVLFKNGNGVSVSARSLGEMNVQLTMEALGGGGHLTMAACQICDLDFKQTKEKLKDVIQHQLATDVAK